LQSPAAARRLVSEDVAPHTSFSLQPPNLEAITGISTNERRSITLKISSLPVSNIFALHTDDFLATPRGGGSSTKVRDTRKRTQKLRSVHQVGRLINRFGVDSIAAIEAQHRKANTIRRREVSRGECGRIRIEGVVEAYLCCMSRH